jgi:hypothetical protein
VSLFLLLALASLAAAGVTWSLANPGLQAYRPTTAVVVASSQGKPPAITVQFEAADGQTVEAMTDRLTLPPPVGAPIAVRYDPADPEQVVMEGYSATPLVTKVLVGLFGVALASAWFAWRRDPGI